MINLRLAYRNQLEANKRKLSATGRDSYFVVSKH